MKKIVCALLLLGGLPLAMAAESPIRTEQLSQHLYLLYGKGGNVVLSVGDDGNYLIDDQYPEMSEAIIETARNINPGELKWVINTHYHPDHTGGNANMVKQGADIIAQQRVYERLSDKHGAGSVNLPRMSFADELQLHFNNEHARLVHYPNAHTDGDSVVFFEVANVVHMADIYFNLGSLPYVDVDGGGSLNGVINAVEDVLPRIKASTKVVPGHGPLSDKAGLIEYLALLKKARGLMLSAMADGASMERVLEARPLASLNLTYSNWLPEERVTRLFYRSLKASKN